MQDSCDMLELPSWREQGRVVPIGGVTQRRALHLAKHLIRAGLEGDVEELAHLGQLPARPHQPLREVPAHRES